MTILPVAKQKKHACLLQLSYQPSVLSAGMYMGHRKAHNNWKPDVALVLMAFVNHYCPAQSNSSMLLPGHRELAIPLSSATPLSMNL
jgi:hypothetical protein